MASRGRGRFINRPTKTGAHTYDKFFIYVPTEVARDSAFPFREGDEIDIQIDPRGRRLLVRRV